ncbi:hypothetical protein NDU88_009613 [Pleurodeles waltl]|uniref:Uncharacterized protein n=1 Tax=Pleurodeles waltl TaxID=8319 RepID=A0AAV7QTB0_PLEWA|nr:hypothetical protein NDU88_009613 [Pleurodeles waltl]
MLFVASSEQPGERSHLRQSLLIPQCRSPFELVAGDEGLQAPPARPRTRAHFGAHLQSQRRFRVGRASASLPCRRGVDQSSTLGRDRLQGRREAVDALVPVHVSGRSDRFTLRSRTALQSLFRLGLLGLAGSQKRGGRGCPPPRCFAVGRGAASQQGASTDRQGGAGSVLILVRGSSCTGRSPSHVFTASRPGSQVRPIRSWHGSVEVDQRESAPCPGGPGVLSAPTQFVRSIVPPVSSLGS